MANIIKTIQVRDFIFKFEEHGWKPTLSCDLGINGKKRPMIGLLINNLGKFQEDQIQPINVPLFIKWYGNDLIVKDGDKTVALFQCNRYKQLCYWWCRKRYAKAVHDAFNAMNN